MIRFGASGSSDSFFAEGHEKTVEMAKWLKERGLDCYEYSFGRGVPQNLSSVNEIREAFEKEGVEISVHAPYFINFSNPDDEMAEKSYGYVLNSAALGKKMGANRVVFHPASQGKAAREDAVALCEKRLQTLSEKIYDAGMESLLFCPETMGKLGQIGTVEEIARFCKIAPFYVPCVDFGHVNARENGSLKTEKDYLDRLNYLIRELGEEKMQKLHVHFSKIEYGTKGEIRHLTFADAVFGPPYEPFLSAVKRLGLNPYIVTESAGTQAEDAWEMKKTYQSL